MSTTDPDFQSAIADFKRGGWIVSFLGLAGATVSMLLGKRRPWGIWAKRIVAGFLTGIIMYFTLHGVDINPLTKSVLMCTCGAIAPELLNGLRAWVNAYGKKKRKR